MVRSLIAADRVCVTGNEAIVRRGTWDAKATCVAGRTVLDHYRAVEAPVDACGCVRRTLHVDIFAFRDDDVARSRGQSRQCSCNTRQLSCDIRRNSTQHFNKIIIIIQRQCLWHCHHDHGHCESSPCSYDECRLSAGWPPTVRPSQPTWAVSPPINGCYHPHPPSPFVIITQPESCYSVNNSCVVHRGSQKGANLFLFAISSKINGF